MLTLKVQRIGPKDHGRPMSEWEFAQSEGRRGYKYELIDGRIYAMPYDPDPPETCLEDWIDELLSAYSKRHPEIINQVVQRSRVYVPDRPGATIPQPDVACYCNFPLERRFRLKWYEVSPLIVVEVLVNSDPKKDLIRNVELYLEVPSIREYWVLDGRIVPEKPRLLQHRRHGKKWIVRDYPFGSVFETRTLPGFKMVLDPLESS